MRSIIIGFVAGAGLLQWQARLPSLYLLGLALIAALLLAAGARRMRQAWQRVTLFAVAGMVLGFAWAGMFAQHYLSRELPKEWEGRDVTVIGTIDSLPQYFERGVRFDFAVERVIDAGEGMPALPGRVALSWYSAFRMDEMQEIGKVQPGERWQLTVRLRRPHGNANPHGFDYEVWLLEQNVRATGYVRPDQRATLKNRRLDAFVPGFRHVVQRARAWLREGILEALPEKEYAGVIVALVIGDQRAVSHSDWKVFNRTGIGHLISI
ncbi:MAG TPA: ComEC/Rec2 family competence protein [Noviherbaspirillum sp.]|nr:ComEC/Rec2 family competence protein [Noviherbaspirillum sp.]